MPKISVVMPAYNAAEWLQYSIESILNQSFRDFEFLIIDDGSTDKTSSIISNYAKQDKRILYFRNKVNMGIEYSRNLGLAKAKGEFIACADADDISRSDRFNKQLDFFHANPDVGIIGSNVFIMDHKGKKIGELFFPTDHMTISWLSLLSSPFVQSSILMRNSILKKHKLSYRKEAKYVDDYDLWARFLRKSIGANLEEILVGYRVHKSSFMSNRPKEQKDFHLLVSINQINTMIGNGKISPKKVARLINMFQRYENNSDKLQRAKLALVYLDLFNEFSKSAGGIMSLTKARDFTIINATRLAFFPPFQPRFINAIGQLFKLFYWWPIIVLQEIPKILRGRMLSLKLKFARSL